MSVFSCFSFSLVFWSLNCIQKDCRKAKEHNAIIPVAQVLSTDLN